MKKNFDTAAATNKFFTQNTQKTQDTQDTHDTQKKPKRKYRYNLTLDEDLDSFLHKIAWEKRTSMTQYINDLIRKEKEAYLAAGGDLEGWNE